MPQAISGSPGPHPPSWRCLVALPDVIRAVRWGIHHTHHRCGLRRRRPSPPADRCNRLDQKLKRRTTTGTQHNLADQPRGKRGNVLRQAWHSCHPWQRRICKLTTHAAIRSNPPSAMSSRHA
jgi:hypothetical protein